MKPKIVLTIAGSDSSGGAGIQADLKTIAAHGCYGASVITALTAQNTRGVTAVHTPPAEFLAKQIQSVLTDFAPQAIKIGMLPNASCVRAVASELRGFPCPIVLDPVMVATSGSVLAENDAVAAMRQELFPLAALITPNIPEAERLSGIAIQKEEDMEYAAKRIGVNILVKGGHLRCGSPPAAQVKSNAYQLGDANDLLFIDGKMTWLRAERVLFRDPHQTAGFEGSSETHGTGCTLSSAIACNLALGHTMEESVKRAKPWLTQLLREKPDFQVPNGPLFHRSLEV